MTDIAPLGHRSVDQSAPVGPVVERSQVASLETTQRREADQVEVSPMARYLNQLRDLDTYREDLVDRVRSEIRDGSYETPERLDGAIDQLIEEEPGLFDDAFETIFEQTT